jgi:hypothetical protein
MGMGRIKEVPAGKEIKRSKRAKGVRRGGATRSSEQEDEEESGEHRKRRVEESEV